MASQHGQDAKFFQRGKIEEFRAELQAAEAKDKKYQKRKTVLKKIVANITMGNDTLTYRPVSPLFHDVIQCISTPLLEIKKKLGVSSPGLCLIRSDHQKSRWGQIYILDSLLRFVPEEHSEAELMAERIIVQLQHANSAVVLTTIKVLLYLMNYMENRRLIEYICRKMGPPLVALLSSGPEVQYVALRNILLIIQRRPTVLKNDVKVFFCKYNDPIYVKLAKLEIMYRLAREENAREVLAEFEEYASEVDIDFVRKSVRSIGRLAIKVEAAADSCIQSLLTLIDTKVTYVVQEAVIVIRDIFRRYPGKYEGIIPTLCENLDILDESEAKAAMMWILGQYADRIDNADELLDDLVYNFLDEPTEVQLALLTAVVKLFIFKSSSETAKALVHKVLKWATEEVDNPDLRDRGFMYWRMLAMNPALAQEIVLAEKPAITTDADRMDRGALDQLLLHAGTLGSIYHKNPETFIRNAAGRALVDTPALNPASRAVLVPLSRPHLPPTTVAVSGPGPVEPTLTAPAGPSKPTPPIPSVDVAGDGDLLRDSDAVPEKRGRDVSGDAETDEDGEDEVPDKAGDPYANLDGAFSGYLADKPQPIGSSRAGNVELDDLLL
ncbi:hypothetical protein ID866_1873 [Astraeus odoratus]|nr:hypothetical protein ID866_1873 [Astraeus odoratus]